MKYNVVKFYVLAQLFPLLLAAQKNDTMIITANTINVAQLKDGKSNYLVYFVKGENGVAADMQLWHIDVKRERFNNQEVITVAQNWDYKDSVVHTAKSICRADDFKPVYHESWWKTRGKQVFDLKENKVWLNDMELTNKDTSARKKYIFTSFQSAKDYFLNWHLDLEVFSTLTYKNNRTFLIPYYEFGYDIPRNIAYSVTGEDVLMFAGKKIPCWLLTHEEPGNKETFWISKETNEVLKMAQQLSDNMYRYKIKLA